MHYINILIYYLDFTFAQQLLHMKEFNTLFNLLYKLIGTPSQLKHIYKVGWGCIIADLDYTQAKDLCAYRQQF